MGFSVSLTREGVNYAISGEDFSTFYAFYHEVDGIEGFIEAVRKEHEQIAAAAVAPIAAADQGSDEPEAKPDELARLIENAPDARALEGLYRAHRDAWNPAYNDLAKKRRAQLDKQAKKAAK